LFLEARPVAQRGLAAAFGRQVLERRAVILDVWKAVELHLFAV
jgi:hypothetical protein